MTESSEGIIGLYERYADAWDRNRLDTIMIERQWLARFTDLLPPGSTILDLGCGSGQPIARHLIKQGFQLVGVDSSPTLIAKCRARFPDHEWIVADMRTLALQRQFHGVIAWDSFFHLAQQYQRDMFPIFAHHAADNAPLLFTSGPEHGEAIGTFQDEPLYHASLSPEEYQNLLHVNGFKIVTHVASDPDCGFHTVWLAQANRR